MPVLLMIFLWLFVVSAPLNAEKLTAGIYEGIINMTIPKKDFVVAMDVFMREFTHNEGINVSRHATANSQPKGKR